VINLLFICSFSYSATHTHAACVRVSQSDSDEGTTRENGDWGKISPKTWYRPSWVSFYTIAHSKIDALPNLLSSDAGDSSIECNS